MERNWRQLTLRDGEVVYVDAAQVVMLETSGSGACVLLATGVELLLADPIEAADTLLGCLRLRGVDGYRINPEHVIAIESTGSTACRLRLSTGTLIDAHGITAAGLCRAIEQQEKYPWDTIRMVRS